MWALMYMSQRNVFVTVVCLPELRVWVCMMRICFRHCPWWAGCEDVTAVADTSLPFYSCVDSILPKAVECMVMEVGSWGTCQLCLDNTKHLLSESCTSFQNRKRSGAMQPLWILNITLGLKNEYIGDLLGSCWELNEWDSQDRITENTDQASLSRMTGSLPSDQPQLPLATWWLHAGLISRRILCVTDDWRQNNWQSMFCPTWGVEQLL